jgi:hypothetical protein
MKTLGQFEVWLAVGSQAQWAAANDKLPPEVCGSSVSAPAVQRQVFGKDPAAGNPWGA